MALFVLTHPLPDAAYVAALRAAAPELPVWTPADMPPPEAVEALLAWRIKPGLLAQFPNLRVVCSIGAGVDKLLATPDLPPQVHVTRVVDPQQSQALAQYVVACALRHLRELALYEAQQAQGHWLRHPVRPLAQCRVGILGQGEVGQAVARALVALGLPVAVWGRSRRTLAGVTHRAGDDELPLLLAQSDVLVCTLPLTPATRGLLDARRLAQLPRGAYVINVGRGELLVEDDLLPALNSGHLAGAALDVFEREPLPAGHWLWRHPRVFASPHIAGEARVETVAAATLLALHEARLGQRPTHAVSREAGY